MNLDTGEVCYNLLTHFSLGSDWTIMGTLHEDLHAVLYTEVTGWGISSHATTWEIPRYRVIMLSSQSGARLPVHGKVTGPR
jgi:hypothetical protein